MSHVLLLLMFDFKRSLNLVALLQPICDSNILRPHMTVAKEFIFLFATILEVAKMLFLVVTMT